MHKLFICATLAFTAILSACSTPQAARAQLEDARQAKSLADSVRGRVWAHTNPVRSQNWDTAWLFHSKQWELQFDSSQKKCDSARVWRWAFWERQAQINYCFDHSTVLKAKARALASSSLLIQQGLRLNRPELLGQALPDTLKPIPQNCRDWRKWQGIPKQARDTSSTPLQKLQAGERMLDVLLFENLNIAQTQRFIDAACQSSYKPDPRWPVIEGNAWNWQSFNQLRLVDSLQFIAPTQDSAKNSLTQNLQQALNPNPQIAIFQLDTTWNNKSLAQLHQIAADWYDHPHEIGIDGCPKDPLSLDQSNSEKYALQILHKLRTLGIDSIACVIGSEPSQTGLTIRIANK